MWGTSVRRSLFAATALVSIVVVATAADAGQPRHHRTGLDCNVEQIQRRAGRPISRDARTVEIVSAVELTTTAPAVSYCRVDGYVVTQGPGPDPNHVNFMVALPEGFEQRYFFVGVGGSAGIVPPPPDAQLREGYAVAGTDGGSPTPGIDWRFAIDRTKAFDYGQRGVHVSAVATQRITRAFYGLSGRQDELFSYISGCSGGGRMGNAEASTYPDTFDGVILGAPGIDPQNILLFGRVADLVLENPDTWVSPQQLAQLEAAVVEQFDDADGADDGLIWDPSRVSFDPASLGIFTPPQLELLDIVLGGLDTPGASYPGFSLANPIGWSSFLVGLTPPPWTATTAPAGFTVFDTYSKGLFGPDYDFTTQFRFDDRGYVRQWRQLFDRVYQASGEADPADLARFERAGGKLLIWHGVADNAISINDTIEYYDGIADIRRRGDVDSFARLFPVPGLLHCGGGPGPVDVPDQALSAIVDWVEYGHAPDSLVADAPGRSFRLCPYPEASVFAGGVDNPAALDVNDAANWSCAEP